MSAREPHAAALLRWPGSIPAGGEPQQIVERALAQVEPGQLIGIGSGVSAALLLNAIARRSAEQPRDVTVICASFEAETVALNLGLTVAQIGSAAPDWALDGADEVDPDGRLLTQRAGALVKTRLLWRTAERMFLAAEPAAFVPALGHRSPLPVEVHRDAVSLVGRELAQLGAGDVSVRLSAGKDGPVFTEAGNVLLDAHFGELAAGLGAVVGALPGVIETGLLEGATFDPLPELKR